MIIDDHNHANYCGHGVDAMIEDMDRNNIDVTWILSCEVPLNDWEHKSANSVFGFTNTAQMPFENAVRYKDKYPDRFVLGYCPNPADPFAIDKLDAAVNTYGVQVCGEWKFRMMLDNWDNIDLFRYCGEKKLPVVLHIDYPVKTEGNQREYFWFGGGIEPLERCLELCPDTVMLGHAPGFWRHFTPEGKVVELMRKYPNLYCDASAGSCYDAFNRNIEFTKSFICEFEDRILHGRDNFTSIHQAFFRCLDISETAKNKILGENAVRLLKEYK